MVSHDMLALMKLEGVYTQRPSTLPRLVFIPFTMSWMCFTSRTPRQAFYYEKAIMFRRWAADYVQTLIEGTYGRKMKTWGFIVDSLINNITVAAKDAHLR